MSATVLLLPGGHAVDLARRLHDRGYMVYPLGRGARALVARPTRQRAERRSLLDAIAYGDRGSAPRGPAVRFHNRPTTEPPGGGAA